MLFYLAHVLITANRAREAIPYLLFLAALPNTSVITWKMLGYACLFDPNRLNEAEQATRRYLMLFPEDSGALLNLACVFGQRGPTPENVRQVTDTLGRAIQLNPNIAAFVKDTLTKPGKDFAAWGTVDSFRKQVGL